MALLASGKVDKTQLPKVEILFELVVTMEKLRHQLHHGYGYIIRRAHSARHSDRRAESNVMALLQLHHELGVDFPVQPPPTPRQSGARTTADGYTVFLAADATEATDPITWTTADPWHESSASDLPCATSHLATYTQTTQNPHALVQVASHIPSVAYGVKHTDFSRLGRHAASSICLGPRVAEIREPAPSLSLVGGSSQLPRLAAGRVAVTNGYSHRVFC